MYRPWGDYESIDAGYRFQRVFIGEGEASLGNIGTAAHRTPQTVKLRIMLPVSCPSDAIKGMAARAPGLAHVPGEHLEAGPIG